VGDPLASPWRRMFSVTLVSLEEGSLSGVADFFVQLDPPPPRGVPIQLKAYLDGVPVFQPPTGPGISLDTRKMSNGPHRLRVVAEFGQNVLWSAQDERAFTVKNPE